MDELKLLMDLVGWLGAASLLSAYLLISNGKVKPKTFLYQGLNILGSFFLIANTYYYGTMALVFLNSVWALIGLNSIRHMIKQA